MYQQGEILIRDNSGDIVARFDDWISYEIKHRANGVDTATFVIDGNNVNTIYFGLDYLIEYWRQNRTSNIAKYREAVTFHRTFDYDYDNHGQLTYTSISIGLNDLLNRRIIYNYAGGDRTSKSDAAETVMKEFVNEQAGPGAASGGGRLVAGDIYHFYVEPDKGTGDTWDGARAWQNLLKVLQGIGDSKSMAFWVELFDETVPSFIFRAKVKPLGVDRSNRGIVASTGRNSAGNYPVIFSDQLGNAISPSYGIVRDTEANVAIVLGRGNEDERNVREVSLSGESYDTASLWNRREIAVHATQETTDDALDEKGEEVLKTTIPQVMVGLEVVQHPSCLYGRDYFLGDIVTCRVRGNDVIRTITEVSIKVEGRARNFAEQVKVTLSNE